MIRFPLILSALLVLAACSDTGERGPLDIAVIGSPDSLFQRGVRLSVAGQHLRQATAEGLVALDASGQVVPAIAERWIVTDDGMSYIFRLRSSQWSDGSEVTANDVRRRLLENLRRLDGTSLGLDLAKVSDVRAMTGRVVEITLASPMPDFLRLLAQPEMGLVDRSGGTGPMAAERGETAGEATLVALPPEARGLPARRNWEDLTRELRLRTLAPRTAIEAFSDGEVDLVLNGQIAHLPLADTGPLSRGTVRIDPALGLFGLSVRRSEGVLSEPDLREALSMAIDRTVLMQPFNIGGWEATTRIVPAEIAGEDGLQGERWASLSLEDRRSTARQRIAAFEASSGRPARLRVAMPEGPGGTLLFESLAEQWGQIGVEAVEASLGEPADLVFRDRLLRFLSPRWYLNQFHCSLRAGLCSSRADALVAQSLAVSDAQEKARLLSEAHAALLEAEVFIPFGRPIRWSLVRSNVAGFAENQWGLHPLFPLAAPTI